MPRKPKLEKKTITVVVNGTPVAVSLHPPTKARKSWYAYWAGLVTSKSTGHHNLDDAILAAENMVKNGGKRAEVADVIVSDEEFEQIQRMHFGRKTDEKARARAMKSLDSCMEAIGAFREITGLAPITLATPDDCARFQRVALTLPNGWRKKPVSMRRPVEVYTEEARKRRRETGEVDALDDTPRYSPNNVLKWSRSLHAAFERVNRNAFRRKCVRGVVHENKLLTSNLWSQFTWIEGKDQPIRQFDGEELLSLLTFLETVWSGVPAGATAAKVFFWSGCRKLEIAGLTWDSLRVVGREYHFEIVGKWGIEKWFRVPESVYRELLSFRNDSPFVFAAYVDQLHQLHAPNPNWLRNVGQDFTPKTFGRWFYQRIKDWSETTPKGRACVHVFRKTTLQYARRGEDINRQVASDVRVTEGVLMTNYVKETDEEMRQRSNRTYQRIVASMSPEVALGYGYAEEVVSTLENSLRAATEAKDWALAAELVARLAKVPRPEAG